MTAILLFPIAGNKAPGVELNEPSRMVIEQKVEMADKASKSVTEYIYENYEEEMEANFDLTPDIDYRIALGELGYYKNDYLDQNINIRNGVLRFQSHHNLMVDGSFGKHSQKTLQDRLTGKDFRFTDIIVEPPSQGKWIVINKTKRILTLYQGKEVIDKYPIAQGKNSSLTPEGKFTVANKIVNPAWGGAGISAPVPGGSSKNPLGYRWIGISYKGGASIGIHGNNSPMSIGSNVSLGCVRMINSDVEKLFELVELGIPVWIASNDKLETWGVYNESYTDK